MFRDLEQSSVDFDDEIEIGIYLNNTDRSRNQVLKAPLLKRQLVKPPGSEQCDYYANKRIEMGYYEKTVTLAPYPQGYHVYFVRCCRNIQNNITSGSDGPDQGQTYYCFIPNPALENSSPFFSGVPSPYMCNNDTNSFLNRAIDIDGDSLVYRFVHPFQGGSPDLNGSAPSPPQYMPWPIVTVDYQSGYGTSYPFGVSGYTNINPSNGLTTLMARTPGSYIIAIEVLEYRNGVLLSSVRLDMQILVLDCPPNRKPKLSNTGGKYFEVEAGNKLCFTVTGKDFDVSPVQNVTVFATGDILTGENGIKPPLAKMTKSTAPGTVSTDFCWTPSCEQYRDKPYLVTLSVQDDGCPPKYENYNIEIKVNKFKGADKITGPKRVCTGEGYEYEYRAEVPSGKGTFFWAVNKGEIIGRKDSSVVKLRFDGINKAQIKMVEISQFGCPGDTVIYDVDLVQSPQLPIISGEDTVCLGSIGKNYTAINHAGSTYNWFISDPTLNHSNGNGNTFTTDWTKLGDFRISVIETNTDGCSSDTAEFDVNVRKPNPGLVGSITVCPNAEKIVYVATGGSGSTYNWNVVGGTQVSGNNSAKIEITWGEEGLGFVKLIETDKWGCVSDLIQIPVKKTYNLDGSKAIGDTNVCEFDAGVPYYVIYSSGSVYRWSINGGIQASGDSTSKITINWGAFGLGRIGVQQWAFDKVNNRECISPVVYVNVKINPIPTANTINGDFEMCQTTQLQTYSVNGFVGSTYHWEINGSDKNIVGQGTNQIQVAWPLPGTYSIRVTELSKDSCPGQPIDTVMIVRPKPTAGLIEGEPIVCFPNNNQIKYKLMGFPNSTYQWFVTGGSSSGGNVDSIIIDFNNQGYAEVAVVETSEYGCVGDTIKLPVYINNLQLDLDRVSVGFPDDKMHIEWRNVTNDLTSTDYSVWRRAYNSEILWSPVVSTNFENYLEKPINTDEFAYEYQIESTDMCGNKILSEIHRSILLEGVQDSKNSKITLQFSPYVGWDNGVERYELYRSLNEDKTLYFSHTVAEQADILVDVDNQNYRQCFRIKAYELAGQNKVSWSNEICFFFSPDVFVPTAFSPNKDGLNETFLPVTLAVKDFEMKIYNRWGEHIFTTTNPAIGWDGTYKGVESPLGVYAFIVTFTDSENNSYQRTGTFHLMR